jgi:hypothetical protein
LPPSPSSGLLLSQPQTGTEGPYQYQ